MSNLENCFSKNTVDHKKQKSVQNNYITNRIHNNYGKILIFNCITDRLCKSFNLDVDEQIQYTNNFSKIIFCLIINIHKTLKTTKPVIS